MAEQWPDDSLFEPFDIFEETYKTVDSHEIKAAIIIPKGLEPGVHPVIINVHGGFLTTAHCLFAPFFSPWTLDLAIQNSAVIVSADYRLLPSANGVADILEDLEDFWQWTRSDLTGVLERRATGHSINLSCLALTGNSAGGYAVMQLALSHPDDVSVVAMVYPFVDPQDDIFMNGPTADEPTVFRTPLEDMPSKDVVVAWIERERKKITTKAGFERGPFNVASVQYGLFYSNIFDNKALCQPDFLPLMRIKAGAKLPKNMWIMHGDDDSVIHIRATHKLVGLIKEKLPGTNVRLDVAAGKEHGFDHLDKNWESFILPGGLDFVKDSWLKG